MDYMLKKAKLLAKLQMSGGSKPSQKAQLLAKMKMHGDNKPSLKTQVEWDREKVKTLGILPRLSAGNEGKPEASDPEGGDDEGRAGERQDRLDHCPEEEEQADAKCRGGQAAGAPCRHQHGKEDARPQVRVREYSRGTNIEIDIRHLEKL